jgi:hypothetical protein
MAGRPSQEPPPGIERTMPAANPFAPPGARGGYGRYEFNDLENGIIERTANRARAWGILAMALGGLNVVAGGMAFLYPILLANLVSGVVSMVVGASFLRAGRSLSNVVTTQGEDLRHMMEGLDKVGTALMVQMVTTIIGFLLAAFAIALATSLALSSSTNDEASRDLRSSCSSSLCWRFRSSWSDRRTSRG